MVKDIKMKMFAKKNLKISLKSKPLACSVKWMQKHLQKKKFKKVKGKWAWLNSSVTVGIKSKKVFFKKHNLCLRMVDAGQ